MAPGRRSASAPAPAYLIVGEDSYLRERFREEILAAALPTEAREFALTRFSLDQVELEEILQQALSRPMLAPRQVFWVRDFERLADVDPEPLRAYLEHPADFTVLIFEAATLDRRRRLVRLLEEHCEVLEAASPQEAGARRAAEEMARELNLDLGPEAAEELVYSLGSDLGRLRRELEKLRAFAGSGRRIGPEEVAAVVTPARQFTVYELVDRLAEGRRAEALGLLRKLLAAGESPVGIVGLLAWLYRQLLVARSLPLGLPAHRAAGRLRAPRTRAESLLRQARRFDPTQLRDALAALLEADRTLKSSPPDPAAVLDVLLVRLTGPPAETARSAATPSRKPDGSR